MKKPFQVRCREASYDETGEMLVLLCFFEEFGESRIVHFPRADFHFKHPENQVPHIEMQRTAELFKGKRFSLVIDDDPNRSHDAEEHPEAMAKDFREMITDQMEKVSEGLTDPQRQLARRLGDIVEKDLEKKQKMGDVLADEMLIRARLKDIDFGV